MLTRLNAEIHFEIILFSEQVSFPKEPKNQRIYCSVGRARDPSGKQQSSTPNVDACSKYINLGILHNLDIIEDLSLQYHLPQNPRRRNSVRPSKERIARLNRII